MRKGESESAYIGLEAEGREKVRDVENAKRDREKTRGREIREENERFAIVRRRERG